MDTNSNQLDDFFTAPKTPKKRKLGRFKMTKPKSWLGSFLPQKQQLRLLPKVLSPRERITILVLVLMAFASLISIPVSSYYHFTEAVPDFGGSFSEGLVGNPKYINPLLAQNNDVDRDLADLIFPGLMKQNERGEPVLSLAESYQVSENGLSYTFRLRDNLKWHDGFLLNADDVVFTVLTAQNADYASPQRPSWQGVEVERMDDRTVVFKLKNKYAQFLSNLTLGILPKHLWENVKPANFSLSELNIKPVGSGPYKFSKIKRDTAGSVKSFELASFELFHSGRPFISKVTFKFYASEEEVIRALNDGQVDSLGFVSAQKLNSLRFPGRLNTQFVKIPRYFGIFFNQNQSKTLSDKNVRLALNHATDKASILSSVLSGRGTIVDSAVLPGILDIPDTAPKYDFNLEKSTTLLDQAGWKIGGDGLREKTPPAPPKGSKEEQRPNQKLEIRLTTSNWPELVSVAETLKNQWRQAGVDLKIEILPLPELQQAIKERNYESLLFGEVLSLDPDPFSFWHSSNKKDPGLNLALYDNKQADKLLEEARQILDPRGRRDKYEQFQKLVAADIPAIFLYSQDHIYPRTAKIKNGDISLISVPADRFDNITGWYINSGRSFKK